MKWRLMANVGWLAVETSDGNGGSRLMTVEEYVEPIVEIVMRAKRGA